MDSKRRKMKEDLEEREARVKRQKTDEERAKANFKAEIERLKRERTEILEKKRQEKQQQGSNQRKSIKANFDSSIRCFDNLHAQGQLESRKE